MSRVDQYDVSVTINGNNTGTWDKMTGGNIDSTETKYKPGGMGPQISLGGTVEVTNIVVTRLYVLARDHPLVPYLKGGVGKATVVVIKQPLDVDGNKFGKPIVYQGKLKQLTLPEPDSEGTGASLVELEVSTAALVSA
jgi:hypothetical protein